MCSVTAIPVCARDTASTSSRTTTRTLSSQLQIRRQRRASQSGSQPLRLAGLRFLLRRFLCFANSIRPVQFDLDNPYVNIYSLSIQRELPWETVATVAYAGSRGVHLLRSNDVNTAVPIIRSDGTPFFPSGAPRQNPAFSTIELKSSDGNLLVQRHDL